MRKSKRGDFRVKGKHLLITVNRDPNIYRFIITLVHELAHLKTYKEYKLKVKPHGDEWKGNHRQLFYHFDLLKLFQGNPELEEVLDNELENPSACSGINLDLEKKLIVHDLNTDQVFLDDLPEDAVFEFRSVIYRKLETRRTRVLCLNLKNSRKYTISKASTVREIKM
ncbi:SprT family zinc-dependent metalloprotease [bacterium]|nr:SprT family zinc-dependent metalloprotease [bacterium]